jgi:alanine racemase
MSESTELVIDLGALRRNLDLLADRVEPAQVMFVVKNDAYGHGLEQCVATAVAAGIRWIGALDVPTALRIRQSGAAGDARLFAWLLAPGDDYRSAVGNDIELGVSTLAQLDAIALTGEARTARVHLKIDTGLHRNGASARDWPALVDHALELRASGLVDVTAVWTHIAEASDEEDSLSIERFERAWTDAVDRGLDVPLRHLAASAAAFARPDARFDLVRLGAFAYGLPEGGGPSAAEMGLRQVMALRTRIVAMRTTSDGRLLAGIPLGYADGLPTTAPGRVSVASRGVLHPLTAPLEVDTAWFEPSTYTTLAVGDEVVVWGPGDAGEQTLQHWANATGTISEELVVRLPARLSRRHIPA